MRFEDFVLQLDASSRGDFRARVLKSPFGEGGVRFSLPDLAAAAPAFHGGSGTFRDLCETRGATAPAGDRQPLDLGTELFRSVFQGQVRTLLDKSRGQLDVSPDLGLRFKIKLDPGDEEAGALADLPWELLYDGETEDFFALSRQMSLVRYLDVPRPAQPIPFTPPLRILAVGASPEGLQKLDLQRESRRLEELGRNSPGVEVQLLTNASIGAVREALSGDTFHVLHFMGHGTFDVASGEGMLAFEKPSGAADLVSGKAFATKLRDLRSLGVVTLNACETARAGHQRGANPFRGVATALVLGGIPAVVAMQRPISDTAAIGFSSAFYHHLARGSAIDQALTEGRQAIHSARPDTFEWATPVLFLRMPEGKVFVPKPEEVTPPVAAAPVAAPAPPAPPVIAQPAPASPGRGPALKIAAGVGGAGLVLLILWNPFDPAETRSTAPETSVIQEPLTSGLETGPAESMDTPSSRTEPRRRAGSVAEKPPAPQPRDATASEGSLPVLPAAIPGSTPAEPQAEPQIEAAAQAVAPAADLSKLSAQVVSLSRREGGGLRLTVRFRNAGDKPLGGDLDAETPALTDDVGGRYTIMESDLPWSGANLRLDLAAGASSEQTFDFPATKLGGKKFYLSLQGGDGRPVKVAGSPITLEGPP